MNYSASNFCSRIARRLDTGAFGGKAAVAVADHAVRVHGKELNDTQWHPDNAVHFFDQERDILAACECEGDAVLLFDRNVGGMRGCINHNPLGAEISLMT